MSLFNGTAIGMMLKSMFPAIIQKVQALEDDGTIDHYIALARELQANGTLDAIAKFASNLERTNALLEALKIQTEGPTYAYQAQTSAAPEYPALSGPDDDVGNGRGVGAGVPERSGADS